MRMKYMLLAVLLLPLFIPSVSYGAPFIPGGSILPGGSGVELTLKTIQTRLISTLLPLAAIIGLVIAGFSFVMGSPNARGHLYLAIMGALIGFGAPSIVAFIQSLVH